ncbi:MAG: type IV pilus assembly protein PilM [bacterium]|nr:type IV pilus assembly protein PilM [bacterium]
MRLELPKLGLPRRVKAGVFTSKFRSAFGFLKRPLTPRRVCVGLDIGTRYIKLAQVKKTQKGYLLEKYGVVELPFGVIVDREFMDRETLIENIRNLVKSSDLKETKISLIVSGKDVILKRLETKFTKRREVPTLVQKLIKENIPFDLKEVVTDYKKLKEEKERLEFVLTGAKNEVLYPLIDVIKDTELLPYNIDIAPFALQSVYQVNDYIKDEGAFLLVNIGFEHTLMTIVKNRGYFFDDDIPIGVRSFTEEIQRVCGISYAEAARVLHGEEIKDVKPKDVSKAISSTLKRLLSRAERILPEIPERSGVILGGGGADIPGIKEAFAEKFNTHCEIGNPLKLIECATEPPKSPHTFDIAIGLAISKLETLGVNLLPFEERIKERNKIIEAIDTGLPFYSSIVALVILSLIGFGIVKKQNRIEGEIKDMELQQASMTDKADLVRSLISKENELSTKIKVVQDLSKHRYARIKLLDELNRLLPRYTWLVALNEESVDTFGINILIRGITTSNFAVSEFMQRLEQVPNFSDVNLSYTQRGEISGIETIEFEIKARFKE